MLPTSSDVSVARRMIPRPVSFRIQLSTSAIALPVCALNSRRTRTGHLHPKLVDAGAAGTDSTTSWLQHHRPRARALAPSTRPDRLGLHPPSGLVGELRNEVRILAAAVSGWALLQGPPQVGDSLLQDERRRCNGVLHPRVPQHDRVIAHRVGCHRGRDLEILHTRCALEWSEVDDLCLIDVGVPSYV